MSSSLGLDRAAEEALKREKELRKICAFSSNKAADRRWENGEDHDPRSLAIMRLLKLADPGDYFDWRTGGDGDNGETLMFGLDVLFEILDGPCDAEDAARRAAAEIAKLKAQKGGGE